jgi:type IV secretory pathway VirB2 component (pilin)
VPTHARTLAVLIVVFSALLAALAPRAGWRRYLTRLVVTTAMFGSLMGLGAVFGKVLGDFLRNVN